MKTMATTLLFVAASLLLLSGCADADKQTKPPESPSVDEPAADTEPADDTTSSTDVEPASPPEPEVKADAEPAADSTAAKETMPPTTPPEPQPKTIVETAVAAEDFETLVAAVQAAGLAETLSGTGPFTVFAPTDEAFAKLPEGTLEDLLKPENKDKLTAILTYHVVPGKVMAADVVELSSAKTVQGSDVAIAATDGKVTVAGANVTATDIDCSNGVIHVIDAVILPPEPKAEPKAEPEAKEPAEPKAKSEGESEEAAAGQPKPDTIEPPKL